jgi:hypothetical protein
MPDARSKPSPSAPIVVEQCDRYPPAPGKFIDLPAGGSFTVEIASNRAKTSLSYNGAFLFFSRE